MNFYMYLSDISNYNTANSNTCLCFLQTEFLTVTKHHPTGKLTLQKDIKCLSEMMCTPLLLRENYDHNREACKEISLSILLN